jgi:hypothetical protein
VSILSATYNNVSINNIAFSRRPYSPKCKVISTALADRLRKEKSFLF